MRTTLWVLFVFYFFNLATGYKGMFILWQHMEPHTYNF